MSSEESRQPPAGAAPSEEELRAAYEAELDRVRVTDMIAQATVTLINLAARRLGPRAGAGGQPGEPGRDLEQARDGIDAARGLLEILERRMPEQVPPLRDALSQLQMAYAAEVGGSGSPTPSPAPEGGEPGQQGGEDERVPGPAQSSGRLWVPGS